MAFSCSAACCRRARNWRAMALKVAVAASMPTVRVGRSRSAVLMIVMVLWLRNRARTCPGAVTISAWSWLPAWVAAPIAAPRAESETCSAARSAPVRGWLKVSAGQGVAGGADRVHRVGFRPGAAGRAVEFADQLPGRGQRGVQPGAVADGALDRPRPAARRGRQRVRTVRTTPCLYATTWRTGLPGSLRPEVTTLWLDHGSRRSREQLLRTSSDAMENTGRQGDPFTHDNGASSAGSFASCSRSQRRNTCACGPGVGSPSGRTR